MQVIISFSENLAPEVENCGDVMYHQKQYDTTPDRDFKKKRNTGKLSEEHKVIKRTLKIVSGKIEFATPVSKFEQILPEEFVELTV